MLLRAALVLSLTAPACAGFIIGDGDFTAWSFGSFGTATPTVLSTGGNPGSRLQVTTVSGSGSGVLAIHQGFSTDAALEGLSYGWSLDVLKGAGSFGQGQAIGLLIQQGTSIFVDFQYNTGVQSSWTTQEFAGELRAANFVRVSGTGTLDLSGGVETRFGFSASNSNSGTLTQYYDNWAMDLGGVPAPGALALLAVAGVLSRRSR
jgi:hypothetical protein